MIVVPSNTARVPGSPSHQPIAGNHTRTVPGAFGVDPRAIGGLGQAVGEAGQEWEKRREEDDRTAAYNAYIQYSDQRRAWDQDSLANRRGGNALGITTLADNTYYKIAKDIGKTLPEGAHKYYGQLIDRDRQSALNTWSKYEVKERDGYINGTTDAIVNSVKADFAANWNDPPAWRASLSVARTATQANMERQGKSADEIAHALKSLESGLGLSLIGEAVKHDPERAEYYRQSFEQRGLFTGTDAITASETVVPLLAIHRGDKAAQQAIERVTADYTLPRDVAHGILMAARANGVDAGDMAVIVALESSGNADARNPKSSATGLAQFTRGTWAKIVAKYGAKHGVPEDLTEDEINDLRKDGALSLKMMGELTRENRDGLRSKLGRNPDGWEVYLAHQQGLGAALALLADPDRNAFEALKSVHKSEKDANDALIDNRGSYSMTAGEFAGMWRKKFERQADAMQDAENRVAVPSLAEAKDRIREMGLAPDAEARALATAEAEHKRIEKEMAERRADAMETVLGHLDDTGSLDGAPMRELAMLSREQLRKVEEYEKRARKAETYTTRAGEEFHNAFAEAYSLRDRNTIAKLDPLDHVHELSGETFRKLQALRNEAIKQGKFDPIVTGLLTDEARIKRTADDLGIKDDKKRYEFIMRIEAERQAREAYTGKKLNPREFQELLDEQTMEYLDRQDFWGRVGEAIGSALATAPGVNVTAAAGLSAWSVLRPPATKPWGKMTLDDIPKDIRDGIKAEVLADAEWNGEGPPEFLEDLPNAERALERHAQRTGRMHPKITQENLNRMILERARDTFIYRAP